MKQTINKTLEICTLANGRQPFVEWVASLKVKNKQGVARIFVRLERRALGNFGDHKALGQGVSELRLAFGPGYRLYYGLIGDKVILLIWGGDKSSQKSDIKLAKKYWQDYCKVNKHE